jgi:hypothetical protein
VHQTYAGILLALIVATDLAIRPWVFRRPAVVPTVLLGIVLAALRQGLHHGVGTAGTWDIGGLPMLAGLAVALAIMAAGLVLLRPVLTRYYGFTRTLCGQSEVLPDVVALALAALAIGTVSWIMTQHIGVDAAKLSWSELSGRPLSFLRIGIVFGMALMAVRRLGTAPTRGGDAVRLALIGMACVGGVVALGAIAARSASQPFDAAANFTNDDARFERFLRTDGTEPSPQEVMARYTLVWYALDRSLDRNDASFERFLAALER